MGSILQRCIILVSINYDIYNAPVGVPYFPGVQQQAPCHHAIKEEKFLSFKKVMAFLQRYWKGVIPSESCWLVANVLKKIEGRRAVHADCSSKRFKCR